MHKNYPAKKTLGIKALKPYQALGKAIRRDAIKTRNDATTIAQKSGWDWQTIRRIMTGERRTDFIELLIIAALISETDTEIEIEALVLEWTREVLNSIRSDTPLKSQ